VQSRKKKEKKKKYVDVPIRLDSDTLETLRLIATDAGVSFKDVTNVLLVAALHRARL
jgi:hypothetical protein